MHRIRRQRGGSPLLSNFSAGRFLLILLAKSGASRGSSACRLLGERGSSVVGSSDIEPIACNDSASISALARTPREGGKPPQDREARPGMKRDLQRWRAPSLAADAKHYEQRPGRGPPRDRYRGNAITQPRVTGRLSLGELDSE